MQSRSSNRVRHQRADKPTGNRSDGKAHFGKAASNNFNNSVHTNGNCMGGTGTSSSDRLSYISTLLLGHSVEVHVTNGSIISGIFHTADVGSDFGIVLKMAHFVKDCSLKGQSDQLETVKRPQTIIVPGNELVQVIAKDLLLTGYGSSSNLKHGKNRDIMIDSAISLSHGGTMRELEPWVPDTDDPQCPPELENIFDQKWDRNWDQFQTNAKLFGVGSSFDEEIYTTKLERGSQRKELEREALKLAREIEVEGTEDLHLAENIDNDEENRFSAVHRVADDTKFDTHNAECFGCSLDSADTSLVHEVSDQKIVAEKSSLSSADTSLVHEVSDQKIVAEKSSLSSADNSLVHEVSEQKIVDEKSSLSSEDTSLVHEVSDEKIVDEKSSLSLNTTKSLSQDVENQAGVVPSSSSSPLSPLNSYESPAHSITPSSKAVDGVLVSSSSSSPKMPLSSSESSSHSIVPSSKAVDGMPVPASSNSPVGSLSSEKSKLNPHAEEFKLNPNARSFVPSSFRPSSPVSESSYCYTTHTSTTPYMPGSVVSSGIGSSFGGHQPLAYTPHVLNMQSPQAYMQSPQAYMQGPPIPMYGQQMYLNQPRPYMYMPGFLPGQQPHNGRREF